MFAGTPGVVSDEAIRFSHLSRGLFNPECGVSAQCITHVQTNVQTLKRVNRQWILPVSCVWMLGTQISTHYGTFLITPMAVFQTARWRQRSAIHTLWWYVYVVWWKHQPFYHSSRHALKTESREASFKLSFSSNYFSTSSSCVFPNGIHGHGHCFSPTQCEAAEILHLFPHMFGAFEKVNWRSLEAEAKEFSMSARTFWQKIWSIESLLWTTPQKANVSFLSAKLLAALSTSDHERNVPAQAQENQRSPWKRDAQRKGDSCSKLEIG